MPLYINDPEVDRLLINELTTRLRLGKTETVRRALKTMEIEAKAADHPGFWEAIAQVQAEAREHGLAGGSPDRGSTKLPSDVAGGA